MDNERFARHAGEIVRINGKACDIETIPMSEAQPVDLVILACKAGGLQTAIDTMSPLVGPGTCIASLINGITSEQRVAERLAGNILPRPRYANTAPHKTKIGSFALDGK